MTENWPNKRKGARGASFELVVDDDGYYRFFLRDPDGQIIVGSGRYGSKLRAERAIDSVRMYAPGAQLIDRTVE